MNLRLTLSLVTFPTLIGSLLILELIAERASAVVVSNATTLISSQASCDLPPNSNLKSSNIWHQNSSVIVALAENMLDESSNLNFSEAESDAAAVLFGCDCPTCINALRQLRTQSLLNNGSGHCWTLMQRRVSPQTVQEILQNLEMREAEQER
jgi:hypothetical protein